MEKIPTLFVRNTENMKVVTRDINPDAAWVFTANVVPTVKKDGTNIRVTVQDNECVHVEKRRNPTREEKAAGAEPGYVDASRDDPQDKHIFAAVDNTNYIGWPDGTWPAEALGPKIQGGVECPYPVLYPFSLAPLEIIDGNPRTWQSILNYLGAHPIEGIVWHDEEHHRYAKIKRRDFGLPWPVKKEEA